MPVHHKKLKLIEFDLDDGNSFECQISEWSLVNDSDDGDRLYTFCPDGEFIEDVDPEWSLELTFYSDWRSDGISTFLQENDGETVDFTLDHHPEDEDSHVRWEGKVKIRAADVGGEIRETETQEVTLQCIGKPEFSRPSSGTE